MKGHLRTRPSLKQGFSTLALLIVSVVGGDPVHFRMFRSMSGLYPLDVSSTPSPVVIMSRGDVRTTGVENPK